MNQLRLEEMSFHDLEEIIELEQEIFQRDAWSRQVFEQDLSKEYAKYWVLRLNNDNAIAGYAGAYFILPDVEISNIAIAKSYQGRGCSHVLMNEILSQAKLLSAQNIFLEVDTQNKSAIGLYEKYGFERISTRKNYYGAGKDAFVMKLRL